MCSGGRPGTRSRARGTKIAPGVEHSQHNMSDPETPHRMSDEDVDDLFGDDENVEVAAGGDESETRLHPAPAGGSDESANLDQSDDEPPAALKTLDLSLPRHAVSHKPEDDTYVIKMPVFLQVDAHPFDPTEFKEKVAANASERQKSTMDASAIAKDATAEMLLNENTVRWRYSNAGNDEIIKQSNAHFVQWDDGLMSLKIGSELFDFRALPLPDNYLARSHVDHEVLQNDSQVTHSASLLPSSTFTATHRKLTEAVKNIQKKDKILNTLTHGDPMMKQRLADENERKNLKARRQLEQKRRLQEERMGKSDSPAPGRSHESAYERFERTYAADEYDEDDFVANDDDEVEMDDDDDVHLDVDEEDAFERGAERLKSVKAEGAARYASAAAEDDRRKRRRIVDSDEDD